MTIAVFSLSSPQSPQSPSPKLGDKVYVVDRRHQRHHRHDRSQWSGSEPPWRHQHDRGDPVDAWSTPCRGRRWLGTKSGMERLDFSFFEFLGQGVAFLVDGTCLIATVTSSLPSSYVQALHVAWPAAL